MRTIQREYNSTSTFTIRNIFSSDGVKISSSSDSVTEATFDLQESLNGDPVLTLTKSGGRIIPASDLLTFKLIKDTDFTDLESNRIYYGVVTLMIGDDDSVATKFKLIFEEN